MEQILAVDFLKGVDNLIENIKSSKEELANIWCSMNAKQPDEFSNEERKTIMGVIEQAITKDYCLRAWQVQQDLPISSRSNYWEVYRERRMAILSKLLVDKGGQEV